MLNPTLNPPPSNNPSSPPQPSKTIPLKAIIMRTSVVTEWALTPQGSPIEPNPSQQPLTDLQTNFK